MLEHATVALRLWHDAVWTLSATLARTNTTKILDHFEGTLGVDLPKDEKDDVEVESVSEEEWLPQTGMTYCVAGQSADSAKFSTPTHSPSTSHRWPAPKIKGQSKQYKEEGPGAEWEY